MNTDMEREEAMMAEFNLRIERMYDDLDMPIIPRMFLYGSIMELKGAILESFVLGRIPAESMRYVIGKATDLIDIMCDACIAPSIAAGVYKSDADIAAEFREIREMRTKLTTTETPEPSVH